jgi:hypothetical protein
MRPEVLVIDPPNANLSSTSGSPLRHQNQLRGLLQAPPLKAAELQRRGIAIDDECAPGLAS